MHSLYDVLLGQHGRQLTPVRCAYATTLQLHRYFEDVVLENNLSALVIESLPLASKRVAREKTRIRDLSGNGRQAFFFLHQGDPIAELLPQTGDNAAGLILPATEKPRADEHFIVIGDARFSALLATVRRRVSNSGLGGDEVIWTFEPDIVYSALEYLMARVGAEHPDQSRMFESAVRASMPKATSLQLTVSVTTKMAHLLQEQAAREIAVNRIATAIRESLELGVILQKTVDEVGAALNASYCALHVEPPNSQPPLTHFYFNDQASESSFRTDELSRQLGQYYAHLRDHQKVIVHDSDAETDEPSDLLPTAVAPLVFQERVMGALQVASSDAARVWQDNEVLLLRTVADQVAIAVNHAVLFAQIQHQALTDSLTGCHNRRAFEMQLDKDLMMARRLQRPVSVIMLDLDHFKQMNDSAGHDAGDDALRELARCLRDELRGIDTAARIGGDEFALILPQADANGARMVAERLRERIEQINVPGLGNVTASLGIATFPATASTRIELMRAADVALYTAKRAGRNRAATSTQTAGNVQPAVAKSPARDEAARDLLNALTM